MHNSLLRRWGKPGYLIAESARRVPQLVDLGGTLACQDFGEPHRADAYGCTQDTDTPELKAKAEQAGGIDKLLAGPRVSVSRRVPCSPVVGAVAKVTDAQSEYRPLDKESLLTELRGKADKDPGLVRERLADIARDPRQIVDLIALAEMARSVDLELASMVLDAAKPLLSRVEPLRDRAGLFGDMAQAYRICDGEADAGLLRDGFTLVSRMRQEGEVSLRERAKAEKRPMS